MSMCRLFSCVVGRGCLLWPVHFLCKILFVFALLHSIFQGQICLLLQVFLDFLLLHASPLLWKGHLFWVLVLKGLVSLHRPFNFSFFSVTGWGIDLDYRDIEWFAFETEQRSFCHFSDCIKVLHFGLFCWPWWLLHFCWGIPARSSRYNGHLS